MPRSCAAKFIADLCSFSDLISHRPGQAKEEIDLAVADIVIGIQPSFSLVAVDNTKRMKEHNENILREQTNLPPPPPEPRRTRAQAAAAAAGLIPDVLLPAAPPSPGPVIINPPRPPPGPDPAPLTPPPPQGPQPPVTRSRARAVAAH